MQSIIILDNQSAIIVDKEKETLARELIKHFSATWREKATQKKSTDATTLVSETFKMLKIDHEVHEGVNDVIRINILTDGGNTPEKANDATPDTQAEEFDPDADGDEDGGDE